MRSEAAPEQMPELAVSNYHLSFFCLRASWLAAASEEIGEMAEIGFHVAPLDEEEGFDLYHQEDHLTVAFRPSQVTVIDTSGKDPTRPAIQKLAERLVNMLARVRAGIAEYSWNVDARISGLQSSKIVEQAFDVDWVDKVIGGNTEPSWYVDEIRFNSTSPMSDDTRIAILPRPNAITYVHVDVRLPRTLDVTPDVMVSQGREFRSLADGIFRRLTGDWST